MQTAKIFQSGKRQAVQLPEEFHLDGDWVYIKRVGSAVVLIPYETPWKTLLDSLPLFSNDFMDQRIQPPMQDR